MGGVVSLFSPKSTREDEQDCETREISERKIEQSAPDDLQYTLGGDGKRVRSGDTLGGDGKRVRSGDNGGASGAIVRYSGVQLHCTDEEIQSLLFSSNPRAAARSIELDPSGSGENVQQLRSFEIDPAKHKIFLSHSGAQKNFVEQLCVDLEGRGYLFPFFDQRHHSLPKGKGFAPLIKQAARLCHVAVIVLSEKFLCSKWPMIELAEFHAAKQGGNHRMSMLPLFYKLEVGDLDDKSIEGRWMPVWNELASRDERIDVSGWAAAVRALRGVNGLSFGKHNNSEVGYRKEIVRSIWEILPGDLMYDSARVMVGYDRICERVSKKFVEDMEVGASVLGLYGTSGLGKTTVGKALCDYLAVEFEGRVCHVELGDMTTRMKRQKLMLRTLCTNVEEDMLKRLTDDLKGLKQLRDRMKWEPVLLVIDNLTDDVNSREEAHEYLKIGFHPRSKVMIIARSKEVLQGFLPGEEFCRSIPKLNVEEAGMIFLRSAAPRKCFSSVTDEERRVLRLCVDKCLLGSDGMRDRYQNLGDSLSTDVPEYGAYHPLALSALGDYFYKLSGNTEVLQWKDSLERDHELIRDVLQSPSITSIIRLQFSTLSWSEQLLFLDVAVFLKPVDTIIDPLFLGGSLECSVEQLAVLHGVPTSVVESRLRNLMRSGMIDWENSDARAYFPFKVHSLYRKFAEWYMTEHGVSELKSARGVFQPCGTSLGSDHRGSKCMVHLVRLRVVNPPRASMWILGRKRMRELQNLVVLRLHDCTDLVELSLAGLDSLRHLQLDRLPNLVTVTLTERSGTKEDDGILKSLVYVRLEYLASLTHMPDLRSCTSIRVITVMYCTKVTNFGVLCPHVRKIWGGGMGLHQLERPPNFRSLHGLSELKIIFHGDVDIGGAMDFASPYKPRRRLRSGQCNVALEDCDDSNEFSDDSDGFHFEEKVDKHGRRRTIIYMSHEKQYVKEGLSMVQNALSYLSEQKRRSLYNVTDDFPYDLFIWTFHKGDREQLYWSSSMGGGYRAIEWRFRDAEGYGDDCE